MTSSPSLCVVDANILIDLHIGGLLREVFALPLRLVAPDVTIAELDEPDGKGLLAYGLGSETLPGEQVLEVIALRARHRQVSANDLFALVLARALKVTLLTGDRHLREVADEEGVEVHGTLWVLDEMVRLGVVTPSHAAEALERMLARGSRLPEVECQRRIQEWMNCSTREVKK
jgi:predicted nucleic acid-binding protein